MRTTHLAQRLQIGRPLGPLVALLAVAALLLFLFDRQEHLELRVALAECDRVAATAESNQAGAEAGEVWSWGLPEAAFPLVRAKTPRRESSFLFLGERLIPLKFPYDTVPDAERESAGWHLIEQDRLIFQLPADVRRSGWRQTADDDLSTGGVGERYSLRLELNGPMSGRRQLAWAIVVLSCFVLSGWEHLTKLKQISTRTLGGVAVGFVALTTLASLYICSVQRLPIVWRATPIGIAWDRLDAIAPGLLLVIACCGWLRERRRWNQPAESDSTDDRLTSTERLGRWCWIVGAALFLVSFTRLLCWGVGATHPWSPVGISSPFCSAAAYSDAAGYLSGAYRLIATGTLDEWNQRRPVNAALFATRLVVGGWNVDLAKWLQAVAAALAAAWAAREVACLYGRYAGLATLALLWGCGRLFLATTLSEPLGFTLGALGLVGMLRQVRTGSVASGMLGLGMMTLAQAARPGAMFVLPALVLSAGSWGRTWRQRAALFALASVMVAATMGVNPLLSRIYGTQDNLTGSNFSYTFAGLASGQSWSEVVVQYQEQLDALPNEKAVATFLYQEGFRLIRSQPEVFIGELLRGMVQFCIDFPRFLVGVTSRSNIDALSPLLVPQVLFLAALTLLALWRQWRCRDRHDWTLWLAVWVGCASSIPLVFLDGGMRVLMGTWPAVLAWLASGLARPPVLAAAKSSEHSEHPARSLACWLAVVVVVAVLGPALVHRLAGGSEVLATDANVTLIPLTDMAAARTIQERWVEASGVAGEIEVLAVDRRMTGPGVSVSDDEGVRRGKAELSVMEWQRELQISGIGSEAYLLSRMPQRPFRLDQVYDLHSGISKILLLPEGQTAIRSGPMVIETDSGLRIFGRRLP